jgi:ABC-type polysaccharide/polyol phosphate transport system ATPase subunit
MKKDNETTAVRLTNITKVYTIHHEKPTLVEKFIKNKQERFVALDDVTLEIKKGERVGIMGPNGSGKTTLLKIIAGITTPTIGTIEIHGKIVSLIDLEAGFHEDLTGEQNIFLNGMLLGMTKKEIAKKLHDIIHFADIKQFIDAPLYTYSSGMKLRLGFSVAIHAQPDILILDEGLGLGDANFQNKSTRSMKQLIRSGITIIIVSHWYDYVKKNTDRIIHLQNGKLT